MAVFAIAGASRKTRFYLLFGEIGVVNLVLLIAAAAGFFLLIDPMVHDMYQNSQIGYGFRPYALLMTSYYLCVMAILGVIVWFMNRIKIKDMMRRIRND